MDTVSVVVPIYNAEEYLQETIESVLRQSYQNIELVLVNDGSSDRSGEICCRYASIDQRIVYIDSVNCGAGEARKKGVEVAKGSKLCFLDSDDCYEPEYIEKMSYAFDESGADLVECAYYIFDGNKKIAHQVFEYELCLERQSFIKEVIRNIIVDGNEAVVLWNKMYRTSTFKQLVNDYGKNLLEDYIINIQYYGSVYRYRYINKPLISYRMTPNSLSRKFQPNVIKTLNEYVLPIKRRFLANCDLTEEDTLVEESNWYLKYIYNYLLLGTFHKNNKANIVQALEEVDIGKITNATTRKLFKCLLVTRAKGIALIYIYTMGLIYKTKRKMYAALHNGS